MPLVSGLRGSQIRRASRTFDVTIRPPVAASSQITPASRRGSSSSQGPAALPSGASATAVAAATRAPNRSCSAVSVQVSSTQTRNAQQKMAPVRMDADCHDAMSAPYVERHLPYPWPGRQTCQTDCQNPLGVCGPP